MPLREEVSHLKTSENWQVLFAAVEHLAGDNMEEALLTLKVEKL